MTEKGLFVCPSPFDLLVNAAAPPCLGKQIVPSRGQGQRRAKILASTRRELAEHGYDGVRVRSVAAEAAVSSQTIYNLYGSRTGLIGAAVTEYIKVMIEATRQSPSYPNIFVVCADIYSQTARSHPEYIPHPTLTYSPPRRPLMDEIDNCAQRSTISELKAMKGSGNIKSAADVERLATQIGSLTVMSILNWAYGRCEMTGSVRSCVPLRSPC